MCQSSRCPARLSLGPRTLHGPNSCTIKPNLLIPISSTIVSVFVSVFTQRPGKPKVDADAVRILNEFHRNARTFCFHFEEKLHIIETFWRNQAKKVAARTAKRNKTVPNTTSVAEFSASVGNPTHREDCRQVTELMQKVTGKAPVMWGPSIIGFGACHYRYESGREGDMPLVGVSPASWRWCSTSCRALPAMTPCCSGWANTRPASPAGTSTNWRLCTCPPYANWCGHRCRPCAGNAAAPEQGQAPAAPASPWRTRGALSCSAPIRLGRGRPLGHRCRRSP